MPAKLNIFQRTMLQWNGIHPYNALHVARIKQPLDARRLVGIIDGALESYGLTGLVIDEGKGTYHYRGGAAHTEMKIIRGERDPRAALSSEIERQLNEPFSEGPEINPFRFFVMDEGSSFYLGLVYFHFICGAENIISLVKKIVNIYIGEEMKGFSLPPELYPGSYSELIRVKPKYLMKWLFALPSLISSVRRSFRPSYKDPCDHAIGFSYFSVGPEQFHALLRASRRWGVTMNDLFLALLLKSLSPLFEERFEAPRRKNISLASIVNIRKDLNIGGQEAFGLFLGSFFVSHIVPRGIDLETLAGDIHGQTVRIKNHKSYLGSVMELGLAGILMPFLASERRKKFYQKNYPLAGGITNINLDAHWRHEGQACPIGYLRTVCTGPVSPLVLAITTVNDILNIGVTFKRTVYSKADVETIIREFTNYIGEIEERLCEEKSC